MSVNGKAPNAARGKKRYLHKIVINREVARPKVFKTRISGKDVEIRLAKNGISVSNSLTTKNAPESSLSSWSPSLARGLKAAMLLYILLYGKELNVKKVFWRLGGGELNEYFFEDRFVYSLLGKGSINNLDAGWKKENVLNTVLKLSQEKEDFRLAALNAYLTGKRAAAETERFLYLWMSMNGLYEYYNKAVFKTIKGKETDRIEAFMNSFIPGHHFLIRNERNRCFDELNGLILKTKDFKDKIKDPLSLVCKKAEWQISKAAGRDIPINAYFYYLFQQTYTYRCSLFHANRPVKLLSFAEESEIIVLRTLSDLLEEFLDKELYKSFEQYAVAESDKGEEI